MTKYFIGVDVGTGSVRAGVFTHDGRMVSSASCDIALYQDAPGIAEQSSENIWQAVCSSVREAQATASVSPTDVKGIGFDATCSLVVLGENGRALAVGAHGIPERNIIVWMDHRAIDQAHRINRMGHPVLTYVGGAISPEMETPKLLWLKEKLPKTYSSAWQFFDLADFLSWRATGSLARSTCTVTCKWTYLAHERRWDDTYFRQIGLGDLADEGFRRIGTEILPPGTRVGGLKEAAAEELGLPAGTAVAASLIDAHAGGVGSIGARASYGSPLTSMAYVFGTSACTMASSREPIFIPGVWGPYFSAMAPGFWLNEGGQSGAGAAIDLLVTFHPAFGEAQARAVLDGLSVPAWLAQRSADRVKEPSDAVSLAGAFVIVPEFLGNRSPHADPEARALVAGLGTERGVDDLLSLYVAGLLGIGYGLRQIVEVSRKKGATIEAIVLSGGAGRHPLVQQLLADCTSLPFLVPKGVDPVLLGAAMIGATAGGSFQDLSVAMTAMGATAKIVKPAAGTIAEEHVRRYAAFKVLQSAERSARALLQNR